MLRAYVESYFLAVVSGDIERVYPGFTRAVPPPSANDVRLDGTASRWPDTSSPVSGSLVGTKRMEILRIDVTENHATAVVCDWSLYTVAWDLGNGEYGYRQSGSPDSGVQMIQVNMTAPKVTTIPSSMPPQMGPSMSPTDDVFGGWRIDAAIFAADKPHWDAWPTQDRDYEACSNLAPDSRERREFLRTGEHPRSDYPTLRPFPGWPVASSA
ncbi:hypothetical protein OKHIL_22200 [Mycolicibacterium mageritense]|nr:hypothetical protein MTY414_32870 [Mycolicibacterium mageritense]